jgi:hypothetical protein
MSVDKSIVPLGTGVAVKTGLNPALGVLLNANQATYSLASGSEWHLLFIKAQKTEVGGGWAFSLQSMEVEEAADLVDDDPPRMVDSLGYPIAVTSGKNDYATPALPYKELPDDPSGIQEDKTAGPFRDYPDEGPVDVQLTWLNRHSLHTTEELGTHIYPLAYHRIVGDANPVAQVIQIARSDWHFWPLPKMGIWSKQPFITSLAKTTTTLPPPPPE